jgi:hypothetical protein
MQVGILPKDRRKNPLDGMVMTAIKIKTVFPFERFNTVYISLARIIDEINAHFYEAETF